VITSIIKKIDRMGRLSQRKKTIELGFLSCQIMTIDLFKEKNSSFFNLKKQQCNC
jgi:hypothetical protein